MRITNLKLHALAITIICAVVVVIYFATQSAAPIAAVQQVSDRYIQLDNATWGRNCDPYVADAVQKWQPKPGDSKPHLAADNNALSALSALCDGKTACRFAATSSTLGDEPLASCIKQLTLRYRCFATDRLTIKEFGQGETVTLDCAPKPAVTPGK